MKKKLLSLTILLTVILSAKAQQYVERISSVYHIEDIESATQSDIGENDILYWVGSGDQWAILTISWCNPTLTLAWGYRWSGSENPVVIDVIQAIDTADDRLSIIWNSDTDNAVTYQDENYDLTGSYHGCWMSTEMQSITIQTLNSGNETQIGDLTCYMDWWFSSTPIPVEPPTEISTPCENPENLRVTIDSTIVTLNWESSASDHLLSLSTANYDTSFIISTNIYICNNMDIGVTYSWSIRAVCGESDSSDIVNGEDFMIPIPNDVTTTANDILYWIGEGENEMIFIVNWCDPEVALAWGYRFSEESVVLKDVMDEIMNADHRFNYIVGAWGVDNFTYRDSIYDLTVAEGNYLLFLINGEMGMVGYSEQTISDGDYVKWGENSCSHTDENWNMSWTTNITPATTPSGSGINDYDNITLSIRPNPATQYVQIYYSGNGEKSTVSLFDLNGRVVKEEILTNSYMTISTSELTNGIYFIRINNSKTTKVEKLIIAK